MPAPVGQALPDRSPASRHARAESWAREGGAGYPVFLCLLVSRLCGNDDCCGACVHVGKLFQARPFARTRSALATSALIADMQKAPAARGNRGLNSKVEVEVAESEAVKEFECLHDGCLDGKVVVVDFASVGAHQDIGTFAAVELVGRTAAAQ